MPENMTENGLLPGFIAGMTDLEKHDCIPDFFCNFTKECCEIACGCGLMVQDRKDD